MIVANMHKWQISLIIRRRSASAIRRTPHRIRSYITLTWLTWEGGYAE